jgi:hypothetical protein
MAYVNPSLTASGTTFAEFQAGGLSGHLELLITANSAANASPTTAATWTATGGSASGGALAAGTYYGVITETDGFGETLPSLQQTQITVAAGNQPLLTFPTLKTGNVARNVYLGAVNGATGGPYYLYATGITAATFELAIAAPANSYAVQPPTANSTSFVFTSASGTVNNMELAFLRSAKDGNLEDVYRFLRQVVADFNQGEPMSFNSTVQKIRQAHTVFAMLSQLCSEIGTLVDANAGTLGITPTGIGSYKPHRTWP